MQVPGAIPSPRQVLSSCAPTHWNVWPSAHLEPLETLEKMSRRAVPTTGRWWFMWMRRFWLTRRRRAVAAQVLRPRAPPLRPRLWGPRSWKMAQLFAHKQFGGSAVIRAWWRWSTMPTANFSMAGVGRKTRVINTPLRRALNERDGGCRFPGCAARYVEGHHIQHFRGRRQNRVGKSDTNMQATPPPSA